MDEIWVRIGLIVGALAVAVAIALIQRRRAGGPVRRIEATGLAPGIYFFSSATCPTCARARGKLDSTLGEAAYSELAWEEDPGVFGDLGIEAVPAVMIVEEDGPGRLYPGQPEKVLSVLSRQ